MKPWRRSRITDEIDNGLKGTQRLASPIVRDVAEQAVLILVPLAPAGREMAGVDTQTRLVSELLQSVLTGARPTCIGTARVGCGEQLASLAMPTLARCVPPWAQRRHRVRGRVAPLERPEVVEHRRLVVLDRGDHIVGRCTCRAGSARCRAGRA